MVKQQSGQKTESKLKASGEKKNGKLQQARLIVSILVLTIGAVVASTLLIGAVQKTTKPGEQKGVGADGFRVTVDEKGNLDVLSIATKNNVIAALGNYSKTVKEPEMSKLLDLNGTLRQQVTFPFTTPDGSAASLYIDKIIYENIKKLEADNIYGATLQAKKVKNFPTYIRAAQTIGTDREYSLMVVNGLTVYRFVISQPLNKVTITEPGALDVLSKLAGESNL